MQKILIFIPLFFIATDASAELNKSAILDNVLESYSLVAASWVNIISSHAQWLFWTLSLISMVWTFGIMALRRSDLGELFAEFIRFTIFTGFFWWLLTNGPNYSLGIIDSMRTIAGNATGFGSNISPSSIANIGFKIFDKVTTQVSLD